MDNKLANLLGEAVIHTESTDGAAMPALTKPISMTGAEAPVISSASTVVVEVSTAGYQNENVEPGFGNALSGFKSLHREAGKPT